MPRLPFLCVLVLGFNPAAFSSIQVTPTTTLAAETAINTSAAASYDQTSYGNALPGNTSKHPMRSLLYSGSTTKIYAQLLGWWGSTDHKKVGYSSNDPVQVERQVHDAFSRGIQGFILDCYGPSGAWPTNEAAFLLKTEAEGHSGFTFAVQVDTGALQPCKNISGCDFTALLISDLKYVYDNFELSPAYQRVDGRPVVYFFDLGWAPIDWTLVRKSVPGNPIFIERYQGSNYNPFTIGLHDGAYAWVVINTADTDDWGQSYLQSFYTAALSSNGHTVGATYKGFDDRLAYWTGQRVMDQSCGLTWISTWEQVNATYSLSNQLEAIQIGTWNDYEEGTEIETGIDPCLEMNASVSEATLNFWPSGAGSESLAVAYYTIFVSRDGENLMKLSDVDTSVHSIDLARYDFGPGEYYFHVKMQSKPGFQTRMSPAVTARFAARPDPTYTIAASRSVVSLTAGTSATVTLNLVSRNYAGEVTIGASADSGVVSVTATPVALTNGGNGTSVVTITTSPRAANQPRGRPWGGGGVSFMICATLFSTPFTLRGKRLRMSLFALIVMVSCWLVACGGGKQQNIQPAESKAQRVYTVTLTATGSGSVANPAPVIITVSVS